MKNMPKRCKIWLFAAIGVLIFAGGFLLGTINRQALLPKRGDPVVLRCTEQDFFLTNSQFLYCYGSEYYYFSEVFGDYYAPDFSKPLREQPYDDTQSWEDYLLERALQTTRDTASMCFAAQKAGYVISDEARQSYEQTLQSFRDTAKSQNFEDFDAYLRESYGEYANEADFSAYLLRSFLADDYAAELAKSLGEEESQNEYRKIQNAYRFEVDRQSICLPDFPPVSG